LGGKLIRFNADQLLLGILARRQRFLKLLLRLVL
jgi:hypothetical protein